MSNIMIDLETMSTASNAAIVAIGAVYFDEKGPIDMEGGFAVPRPKSFYTTVNLQSSIDAGLTVDGSTVSWWLEQSQAARSEICKSDTLLVGALHNLARFITSAPGAKVWGNGAHFDITILENAYRALDMPIPWRFTAVRCYRTLKALHPFATKPEQEGTAHHALDDAIYQAKHMAHICAHASLALED